MRWFVEVNSIGKTDKQSYCVAADTWQRALQCSRALRTDNGPMTGFSIELLDDGFSAVDPMARLRYFVRRAPDDAPLTEATGSLGDTPRPPGDIGTPTAPTAMKSMPPQAKRPSQSPRAAAPPVDGNKTPPF